MLDWRATWQELEPPPRLAVLPLGSIEQHGPYLPIGADQFDFQRFDDNYRNLARRRGGQFGIRESCGRNSGKGKLGNCRVKSRWSCFLCA